jgi:hypothetical protein
MPLLIPAIMATAMSFTMSLVQTVARLGIPPQHAGMASGFLMTGHEVGAALGVAVLSAVATSAGSLTSPAGVVVGFSRGFVAAAVVAVLVAVTALLKMPSARATSDAHVHMH